jgi:hypothetical protein
MLSSPDSPLPALPASCPASSPAQVAALAERIADAPDNETRLQAIHHEIEHLESLLVWLRGLRKEAICDAYASDRTALRKIAEAAGVTGSMVSRLAHKAGAAPRVRRGKAGTVTTSH